MNLHVRPGRLSGTIAVPGSKSHTIRAVALGMMAEGTSLIHAPLVSEDAMSAFHAAESLGAGLERLDSDSRWKVHGTGGRLVIPDRTVDMADSGTSIKIFAALASLSGKTAVFDGDSSLRTRPMKPLLDALAQAGVRTESKNGKCPFSVTGPFRGGKITVNGKSSQYVTAVLFASAFAPLDSEIFVEDVNEQPYIGITLSWFRKTGIVFEAAEDCTHFRVPGRQKIRAFEAAIAADFSTAAFPLTAAAVTGSEVEIQNLDFDDPQGDKAVFGYLERMGVSVLRGAHSTIVKSNGRLTGCELDLNATPDALPAVAAAAAFAGGRTAIRNVAQARIKETDRIACMTRELGKMGVRVTELPDGMVIEGGNVHGAEVESYGDHRIAMALACAGLGAKGETIVKGAECAAVTFPGFFRSFEKLGAHFTQEAAADRKG